MQLHHLTQSSSILDNYMAELRDVNIQGRRDVFRENIERIGAIVGYEISKTLTSTKIDINTPLAPHTQRKVDEQIVVITILRAGLPMHQGILSVFPHAENGFVSAYRKHDDDGSFKIEVGYVACPTLQDKTVILNDPMLATGGSFESAIAALEPYGRPKSLHLASVIASKQGVDYLLGLNLQGHLWVVDIDPELNADKYIVPGLGDAGDLAFGVKLQS